jgi:hypothetical protein
MAEKEGFAPFDQKWQATIRRFSFLGVSAKVINKHSLIPVSPACNWGQRLVLERVLPLMGFR